MTWIWRIAVQAAFTVGFGGVLTTGCAHAQSSASRENERPPRVVTFQPRDLGTFPRPEDQPRFPVANASPVQFRSWLIDPDFPPGSTAQTYLCDFTGDGRLEYMVGGSGGRFIFKRNGDGTWSRHQFRADRGPTDVGAVALDLTGNGLCDVITGTQWLRNPGFANGEFAWPNRADTENGWQWEAFPIAEGLPGPHDQILADLTGDGRLEMIYYQDGASGGLRWFQIPEDPTEEWVGRIVSIPTTHVGLAPSGSGDIDGDGRIDIAVGHMWFQNIPRPGGAGPIQWIGHNLPAIHSLPVGRLEGTPNYAGYAHGTQTWVIDMNGNGRNDIVIADAELVGGRIWWLENLGTDLDGNVRWNRHVIAGGLLNQDAAGEWQYYGRVLGGIHGMCVGDFTGNGRPDVVTVEQDWDRARRAAPHDRPKGYLWENLATGFDGSIAFAEHMISDVNLGAGHEMVCADITGNGRMDIIGKPWSPGSNNALGGNTFILFIENLTR
jgi:hypothetical protein